MTARVAGRKWDLQPGAYGPDGFLLGHLPYTRGGRMHLATAEPYSRTLCGKGQMETVDSVGPNRTLCPDCAAAAGVARADALPVDEDSAGFWSAQGYGDAS